MSFAKDIAKWAESTGQDIDTVRRAAFMDMTKGIVKRTPVDTGRAKGNWQPSTGSPKSGAISLRDKIGSIVEKKAQSVVDSVKGDETLYLTNNLEYIGGLEYGRKSKQAPSGMLRVTVREFQSSVRKAVNKL